MDVPRWRGELEAMPPGHYRRARRVDGTPSAIIRCPDCKETFTINHHVISPDGTVTPSVVCPYDDQGCTFHPAAITLRDLHPE